jgi:hypothetical protein
MSRAATWMRSGGGEAMKGFPCPYSGNYCPYHGMCQANETKPDSCADSWNDDDGMLVRSLDGEWCWTGGRE